VGSIQVERYGASQLSHQEEAILYEPGRRYRQLIESAQELAPMRTAVVHPCDGVSLAGAIETRDRGLIVPVLVGPLAKIERAAVAPDLESGNLLAKELIHLADAEAAGLVLGARVPIMLTSRADSAPARLASCALAQLFMQEHKTVRS
jgi:phosphotransacetylase